MRLAVATVSQTVIPSVLYKVCHSWQDLDYMHIAFPITVVAFTSSSTLLSSFAIGISAIVVHNRHASNFFQATLLTGVAHLSLGPIQKAP